MRTVYFGQQRHTHIAHSSKQYDKKLDIMMVAVDDDDDFIVQPPGEEDGAGGTDGNKSQQQKGASQYLLEGFKRLVFAKHGEGESGKAEPEPTLPTGFSAILNAEEEEIYPADVRDA